MASGIADDFWLDGYDSLAMSESLRMNTGSHY